MTAEMAWRADTHAVVVSDCRACGLLLSQQFAEADDAVLYASHLMAKRADKGWPSYVVEKDRGESYSIMLPTHDGPVWVVAG